MPSTEIRVLKFGGGTFIVAGTLLLTANVLLAALPTPPTTQDSFLRWLAANRFSIALANELLFFANLLLVPSFAVLSKLLDSGRRVSAFAGLSIVALAIPVLAMLDVVQGRLVYPVFGLDLSADSLKLSLSLFYGGLHGVLLMLGAAIVLIGFALRGTAFNQRIVPLSFVTGLLQIAGAYPWLTPVAFNVIVHISLSLWMILIGLMLLRSKPSVEPELRTEAAETHRVGALPAA